MKSLIRALRARPRLVVGTVAGLAAEVALPGHFAPLLRALLAWDLGCVAFLAGAALMFSIEPMARIRRDARRDQEGEWTVFWFTVIAVAVSFAAIIGEFSAGKDVSDAMRGWHVALVALTLLMSWLMTHTLFTLRYAHEYYDDTASGNIAGGLEFPGDAAPDYWDFFYFSLILGMTFQVSDVQITARGLRRLATAHGLIGFLFNTVILALSVNMGASLL